MMRMKRGLSLSTNVVSLKDICSFDEIEVEKDAFMAGDDFIEASDHYKQTIFTEDVVSPGFKIPCYAKPFTCDLNDLVPEYISMSSKIEFDLIEKPNKIREKFIKFIRQKIDSTV